MIKYLGVHICSASKFKLSYSEVKASFHRAVNGLLCKTKGKFDDIVMLRLVDAYCKPYCCMVQMYAGMLNLTILL